MNRANVSASRRGSTLIECVVVFTLIAGILALTAPVLAQWYQSSRRFDSERVAQTSLDRLSTALRGDVHAARTAEIDDAGRRLVLHSPEGRAIEYRASPLGISRLESKGDTATQRELYQLTPSGRQSLEVQFSMDEHLVILDIARSELPEKAHPGQSISIQAALGLDWAQHVSQVRQP